MKWCISAALTAITSLFKLTEGTWSHLFPIHKLSDHSDLHVSAFSAPNSLTYTQAARHLFDLRVGCACSHTFYCCLCAHFMWFRCFHTLSMHALPILEVV